MEFVIFLVLGLLVGFTIGKRYAYRHFSKVVEILEEIAKEPPEDV